MAVSIAECNREEVRKTQQLLRRTFGARLRCPNRRRRPRTRVRLPFSRMRSLSRSLIWLADGRILWVKPGRSWKDHLYRLSAWLCRDAVRLPSWRQLIPDSIWVWLCRTLDWEVCETDFSFVWLTPPGVPQGMLEARSICGCGDLDGRYIFVADIASDFSAVVSHSLGGSWRDRILTHEPRPTPAGRASGLPQAA